MSREIEAFNIWSNQRVKYNSILGLANLISLPESNIHLALKKEFKALDTGWVFKIIDDDYIKEKTSHLKEKFHREFNSIICYDIINKKYYIHNKQTELSKLVDLKSGTIQQYLKHKKLRVKNYLLHYYSDYSKEVIEQYNLLNIKRKH